MKQLIQNYTFNATSKTISFNDYTSISLERVLLVTNVTDNIIIYNFASSDLGGTVAGNVLLLDYNTTSMSNSDKLQIWYEVESAVPSTEATAQVILALTQNLDTSIELLKKIAKILEPISVQDANQRQKVVVELLPTLATVTTVSTVTNMQSVGGVDYRWQMIDQARNTYANGIRANLAF